MICEAVSSGHKHVIFDITLPCNIGKPCAPAWCCRVINLFTAVHFSALFNQCDFIESVSSDTEKLCSWFHSTSQTVLDVVAPLKTRQPKIKSEPRLNDTTRSVRREC